jgi:hypothetical protein
MDRKGTRKLIISDRKWIGILDWIHTSAWIGSDRQAEVGQGRQWMRLEMIMDEV